MSAELLSGIAGIVLSLAFSYIPGLRTWYEKLPGDYKRLVMAIALVTATAGAFGLTCAGVAVPGLTCDKPGALTAVSALIAALVANQATYLITPKRA